MKLIRFGEINKEKPGVLLSDGTKIDVSRFVKDYDEHFFGNQGIEKLNNWLEKIKIPVHNYMMIFDWVLQ